MSSHDRASTARDLADAKDLMAENRLLGNDATENHRNVLLTALLLKLERLAQAIWRTP